MFGDRHSTGASGLLQHEQHGQRGAGGIGTWAVVGITFLTSVPGTNTQNFTFNGLAWEQGAPIFTCCWYDDNNTAGPTATMDLTT